MRKILILIATLMLSLTVTKAQDMSPLAPIIIQFQNKITAVSAEYGTSQVLVELTKPGQTFSWEEFQLSPDGTKLLYSVQTDTTDLTDPNARSSSVESLFLLDLADDTAIELQAQGGVFDRKPAGHIFSVGYRTWSLDGTRVYFTRYELDRTYNSLEAQIVYYALATQQYHLVMRSDPSRSPSSLVALQSGLMVNSGQTWSLYTPDNHVVEAKALTGLYGHILQYEGQDVYALDDGAGKFSTIINIETGEKKLLGGGYHSVTRSLLAGDQSLIALQSTTDVTVYRIGESHKTEKVQVIPAGTNGMRIALSPDGQQMAYLQFNEFSHALLRIMGTDGYSYELPFLADSIVWGSSESIAFHKPVGK